MVKRVGKNGIDKFRFGIDKFDVEMELTPCLMYVWGMFI